MASSNKKAKTSTASTPATDPPKLLTLKSVCFDQPPFRRLGSISLDIAPRLTLIAGRNGVGKSTILALIAGSSGITRGAGKYKTYFGSLPNVNAEEILSLSYERDFVEDEAQKPAVLLTYSYSGEDFQKKGNVSGSEERLRVVPRNEPKGKKTVHGLEIPADGKVPLPTIYLGMMRVMPIGEINPDAVARSNIRMDPTDYELYENFSSRVIYSGDLSSQQEVTAQSVNLGGTKKNKSALYPKYSDYDSTNVSLGQDSLSSIATALASFSKLQRTMGTAYRGGLLVIDEIDAGFHPHAQVELYEELKSAARRLNIQIIATTHSLTMLEHAHADIYNDRRQGSPQDGIIYLRGGMPIEIMDATHFSYIKEDMHLRVRHDAPVAPTVKVYVEDDEAALFLNAILTPTRKKHITQESGHALKVISVKLGCTHLTGLPKADDYFKSVVIVLDADTDQVNAGGQKNIVRLPADPLHTTKQSPEALIEAMCKKLCADADAYPETRRILRGMNASTDHIHRDILQLRRGETRAVKAVDEDRDVAKNWFNSRLEEIKKYKLIEGWVADNALGVDDFCSKLISAVLVATGSAPPKRRRQRKGLD